VIDVAGAVVLPEQAVPRNVVAERVEGDYLAQGAEIGREADLGRDQYERLHGSPTLVRFSAHER
jgi:hypothetical protein